MSAQEKWKKAYQDLKRVEIRDERINWISAMKNYRREAALERKCEALERKIEKLDRLLEQAGY